MSDDMTFDRDIRPLFRDGDARAMSFAFDLAKYDDVRANAEAIYKRLADGSMPCDGAGGPPRTSRVSALGSTAARRPEPARGTYPRWRSHQRLGQEH